MTLPLALIANVMGVLAFFLGGWGALLGLAARQRQQLPPKPALPTAVCPVCGGGWGKWSEIPSSSFGRYSQAVQIRSCEQCGLTDKHTVTELTQ